MSDYVWERYEHAGVVVEIEADTDPAANPQDNDNAGTIYSWVYRRDFEGDEYLFHEPEFCRLCDCENDCENCNDGWRTVGLAEAMLLDYDSVLTVPLRFENYGASGSRLHVTDVDGANAALCFTRKEVDEEWNGDLEATLSYAQARVNELDQFFQGNVWGIVIRELNGEPTEDLEHVAGDVLGSVWGFIGDPDSEWIRSEANAMAEAEAEAIQRERAEAYRWACADVVTVPPYQWQPVF